MVNKEEVLKHLQQQYPAGFTLADLDNNKTFRANPAGVLLKDGRGRVFLEERGEHSQMFSLSAVVPEWPELLAIAKMVAADDPSMSARDIALTDAKFTIKNIPGRGYGMFLAPIPRAFGEVTQKWNLVPAWKVKGGLVPAGSREPIVEKIKAGSRTIYVTHGSSQLEEYKLRIFTLGNSHAFPIIGFPAPGEPFKWSGKEVDEVSFLRSIMQHKGLFHLHHMPTLDVFGHRSVELLRALQDAFDYSNATFDQDIFYEHLELLEKQLQPKSTISAIKLPGK